MRVFKPIFLLLFLVQGRNIRAQDYPASLFGIKSDGSTLNTRTIQFAIDYINRQGGGRLVFSVGRYLTGSLHLKSKVKLHLEEGSVLLGSLNPFDYDRDIYTALILAKNENNLGITGKGIIDGQGRQVALNILGLIHNGIIKDPLRNDRPNEAIRPMLINFRSCENIVIKNVTLKNAASWVETYDQCKTVQIDSIIVDSKAYWNNDGIDIVDCDSVQVTNSYIDAADDGICLKSHDDKKVCEHIWLAHNTIRSSASAIKFGTASYGGFRHIRIFNIKVFDTYRSAVAIEAVDGGFVEDVVIDTLNAYNTGNAFFLRIGERAGDRKSRLQNVRINNLFAEISLHKPDSGYEYEGPVEDQPRNVSPIVITGIPNGLIENIFISNVTVHFPGGGNEGFAKRLLSEIDSIPELSTKYPEFSMFKELPAWGLYIRHARQISCAGLQLSCAKKDYRTAIVLDDVHDSRFSFFTIKEPGNKKVIYLYKSTAVLIK